MGASGNDTILAPGCGVNLDFGDFDQSFAAKRQAAGKVMALHALMKDRLDAGADDFIEKTGDSKRYLARVKAVLRRAVM